MTDAEPERLRPPHVTMGVMRWWWRVKRVVRGSGLALLWSLPFAVIFPELAIVVGLIGLVFAAVLALWVVLLMAFFVRYSLRTLMALVLAGGTLAALIVTLPPLWALFTGFLLVVLLLMLVLAVLDYDPQGMAWVLQRERERENRRDAPYDGEPSGPEPRA